MYAVVEFMNDKKESTQELAVVPLLWLQDKDKKCYWPTTTHKKSFTDFVRLQAPYKKSWPLYRIFKVHYKTASYKSAEQRLQILLESIHEISESTDGSTKSFIHKAVNEGESSDDTDNSDDDRERPSKVLRHEEIQDITTIQSSKATSEASCSGSSDISSLNSNFQQDILETLKKISMYVENHSLILNELLRSKRQTDTDNLIPPPNLPLFPIKDATIFHEFNVKLSNDGNIYKYMVKRLAAVGGSGVESVTRRILRFIISDDVAQLYNWKGRDKLSFEKTTFMAVIYEAAKLNFPVHEKNDLTIANTVKDWLKFAKARLSTKKRKST